jgi:hypothetical protein
LKTTTERSPSSYKAKPRPVSAFSPLYLAENGPRFVGCHRSFKSSILAHQPSTTVKTTTIRILDIRSTRIDHLLARNRAGKSPRRQQ